MSGIAVDVVTPSGTEGLLGQDLHLFLHRFGRLQDVTCLKYCSWGQAFESEEDFSIDQASRMTLTRVQTHSSNARLSR